MELLVTPKTDRLMYFLSIACCQVKSSNGMPADAMREGRLLQDVSRMTESLNSVLSIEPSGLKASTMKSHVVYVEPEYS